MHMFITSIEELLEIQGSIEENLIDLCRQEILKNTSHKSH